MRNVRLSVEGNVRTLDDVPILQSGWSVVAVARWSRSTKLMYVRPVSTGMGDRVRDQFPVRDIYHGM